jgi:hemolysin activation/secretion protein
MWRILAVLILPIYLFANGEQKLYAMPKLYVVVEDQAKEVFSKEMLEQAPLTLFKVQDAFLAYNQEVPASIFTIEMLNALRNGNQISEQALESISKQLVDYFSKRGVIGVYVNAELDFKEGGLDTVYFRVFVALCGQIETLTKSYFPGQFNKNQYRYKKIRRNSPVKALALASDPQKSVINKEKLDEYAFYLNRYPNRRVDIQLRPLDKSGLVGIDYVITEKRPWRLYANVANSGTAQIGKWVYSLGLIHTQAFFHDSIFRMDYATSNRLNFHSYAMSYELPFFNVNRMRVKSYISYNKFSSSQLSLPEPEFRGSQTKVGLHFYQNFFQKEMFFIDWFAALQYRYIKGVNTMIDQNGQARFLLPRIGLHFDADGVNTKSLFEVAFNTTINGFLVGSRKSLQDLGRIDVDSQWFYFDGKLDVSHYLDFYRSEDKNYPKVHELAIEASGQWAYHYRLVPELKIVVGGMYSVRGYPNAFNSGDSGYAASIEYRYHLPRGFKIDPNPKHKLFGKTFRVAPQQRGGLCDWDLVFKGFLDSGYVYNNRTLAEINTAMVSTGVGLQFSLFDHFIMKTNLGVVLKDTKGTPVFIPDTGSITPAEPIFGVDKGVVAPTLVKKGHTRLDFSATFVY